MIKNLFNYLKDIFSHFYWKIYTIKKFWELKIEVSLFNVYYSKFIWMVFDLENNSKMFIEELQHKLMTYIQD